jgi:hypothetical protein
MQWVVEMVDLVIVQQHRLAVVVQCAIVHQPGFVMILARMIVFHLIMVLDMVHHHLLMIKLVLMIVDQIHDDIMEMDVIVDMMDRQECIQHVIIGIYRLKLDLRAWVMVHLGKLLFLKALVFMLISAFLDRTIVI